MTGSRGKYIGGHTKRTSLLRTFYVKRRSQIYRKSRICIHFQQLKFHPILPQNFNANDTKPQVIFNTNKPPSSQSVSFNQNQPACYHQRQQYPSNVISLNSANDPADPARPRAPFRVQSSADFIQSRGVKLAPRHPSVAVCWTRSCGGLVLI